MKIISASNDNYKNAEDLIILEGEISVLGIMTRNPERILKIIIKDGIKYNNAQKILDTAKTQNIKVEFQSLENIEKLTAGKTHGGIIAVAAKRKFLSVQELLDSFDLIDTPDTAKNKLSIAILEGIEDPYNLGYAVRALYAQGTTALIVPERDLNFSETIVEKASTGTFSMMNIATFGKSDDEKIKIIDGLKNIGFTLYCIDKRKDAKSLFDTSFSTKTAFLIGGEKRGISKIFVERADKFVQIPYFGDSFAYSLTAQTSATIISYEIHRQFSQK